MVGIPFLSLFTFLAAGTFFPSPAVTQFKLVASDSSSFYSFGYSVAASSGKAVIGAPFANTDLGSSTGAAYVFARQPGGAWIQTAKIVSLDAEGGDDFGTSVTIDGDLLVAGAPGHHEPNHKGGAAYVFERQGDGTWVQTAELFPADGAVGDSFGFSVSVSGEIVLVGSYGNDDQGAGSGSAYLFQRQADHSWVEIAKLLPNDGQSGDSFGLTVSLSGGVAVMGASTDDDQGQSSGSAYVFERTPQGWIQTAKLLPADGHAGSFFGNSVSTSDGRAVVGSWYDDSLGYAAGSAYVFERQGDGSWPQTSKLLASDGKAHSLFGSAVAMRGDLIVVGSEDDTLQFYGAPSSTYVFHRTAGGSWTQVAELLGNDLNTGDNFGASVALDGNTVFSSSPLQSLASGSCYGFVFRRPSH